MRSRYTFFYGLLLGLGLIVAVSFFFLPARTTADLAGAAAQRASTTAPDPRRQHTATAAHEAAASRKKVGRAICQETCALSLDSLRSPADIDDADYEVLLANSDALALYLLMDPNAQSEIIELATRTDDGNKRRLIRAAFSQLPIDQRQALGAALLQSPDALKRREGVNFLGTEETLDEVIAQQFVALLATEFDTYTKISMIRGLDKPDQFRGDRIIIDGLHKSIRSEVNPHLRGEALVVSARLTRDPQSLFFDVTSAIRSDSQDYSLYGLRALETMLVQSTSGGEPLSWQNHQNAKRLLEALLEQDAVAVPTDVVEEASFVYERHF